MTERINITAYWGYHLFTLKSGVVAEKGKLACIDTADGSITKGAVSATLIPLGIFCESLTGNGTLQVQIELFHEIRAHWWNNDTVTAVTAALVGKACYVKDDQTVTADATGASMSGMVLQVDSVKGVLVYQTYPALALA